MPFGELSFLFSLSSLMLLDSCFCSCFCYFGIALVVSLGCRAESTFLLSSPGRACVIVTKTHIIR